MSNSWNKNEEKDSLVPLFTTKAPSTWMFLRKSATAVAAGADVLPTNKFGGAAPV